MDIFENAERCDIDISKLSAEEKDLLIGEEVIKENEDRAKISKAQFLYYDLPDDCIIADTIEIDEDILDYELLSIINYYPYYLIVSEYIPEGYAISSKKLGILKRNGEYVDSFEPVETLGQKAIKANETLDSTQSKTVYVIGLTVEELDNLSDKAIEEFVRNPYLTDKI